MTLDQRIDALREEAALLAKESNTNDGTLRNRDMLRFRLGQIEEQIDKLLMKRIAEGPDHRCACSEFDDGSAFCLTSFAGGAAPRGAFSTVTCEIRKRDGTTEIRHYRCDAAWKGASVEVFDGGPFKGFATAAPGPTYGVGSEESPIPPMPPIEDVCVCGPGACRKACPVCSRGECPHRLEKTPADKLAEVAEGFTDESVAGLMLRAAIDGYRSTRNAHPTVASVFGDIPDPKKIARFLLDSLTGGALSSLICMVRDSIIDGDRQKRPASTWAFKENLRSNLRALGEDIAE